MEVYILGVRRYLFKEDDSTIPYAKKRRQMYVNFLNHIVLPFFYTRANCKHLKYKTFIYLLIFTIEFHYIA